MVGVKAASWMSLQARYDIETTEDQMVAVIAKIEPRAA
jgi:plasmid maintenance system antidote protein VapI